MRGLCLFVLACAFTWPAAAQISPDEAAARLKAKEAARAVATTQPDAKVELDQLRREVAQLKAERDKLAAELDGVKQQLAKATEKPAPKPGFKEEDLIGMSLDDAIVSLKGDSGKAWLQSATGDAKLYLISHSYDNGAMRYYVTVQDGRIVSFRKVHEDPPPPVRFAR